MGIRNVVLVNPVEYLVDDTFRLGCGAKELIHTLRVVQTLPEITDEIDITIGTTNRIRENQAPLYSPREVIHELSTTAASTAKIGILFGRETNGLTNDELTRCNYQSTIPSAVVYPAMNLSQAVMVYAYELFQASQSAQSGHYQWKLATKADQERLYTTIGTAVDTLPFKTRNGTQAFVRLFRRVLGRTQLETRDVRVLYKLFDLIIQK
jgi:TrmH family RNA methyltransferase